MSIEFIQRWWLYFFIAFALLMYAFAFLGFRVQGDAKRRGLAPPAVTFWSVAVIFFGPIFFPLYLMFRARAVFAGGERDETGKVPYKLCPHCGEENPADERVCKKCRKRMDSEAATMGQKACPYCGTMNPVEATRCSSCDQVIGYVENEDEG